MVISQQRRFDLENTIKIYLEGYQNGYFGVNDDFIEYASFYHLTNEPVNKIFSEIVLNEIQKALSVLASGDQVFHMISGGVQNIDSFDINRLTEYYALGFKKRAIECLNYYEFMKLFEYYKDWELERHFSENKDIEKYVIENMEEEYKWFWNEFLYAAKEKGFEASIFHLSCEADLIDRQNTKNNLYMKDESEYINLQRRLKEVNISYKYCSIMDVPTTFTKYDLIYLSNIMDYYRSFYGNNNRPMDDARNLIKAIYTQNLNPNGEIILTEMQRKFSPNEFLKEMINHPIINNCLFTAYGIKKKRKLK
ncbi:MAG: hypothetical protein IJO33_04530 [Bacilli bacterium]|nr:hypothetical protein [Bacilli bacterium]